MISSHYPILQVVIPLLGAPICVLIRQKTWVWAIALITVWSSFIISILLCLTVSKEGAISYHIGNWPPPWGIEYRIDILSALVLILVSGIGSLVIIFARKSIENEIPEERAYLFYTMFLLALSGLLGMVATGDLFNLFVFLEISSLSTYVLISLGTSKKAMTSAFRYLILGTLGATFYVIGVGILYQLTGTLNMLDLASRIPEISKSSSLILAFGFLTAGIGLKMGLFPLHTWLPNAYTYAPSIITVFLSATATKVAIYVLLRIYFTIFGINSFSLFPMDKILLVLGVVSILTMSLVAIFQTNLKRMLAYSSVAQTGYIIIGVSLLTEKGLISAIVHTFNHALMKGALFFALGAIFYRVSTTKLSSLSGLGKMMPLSTSAFLVSGLSLIGVPFTVGFVSKWYLVLGLIEKGWWPIAILALLSSILAVVYIWRTIEVLYFQDPIKSNQKIKEVGISLWLPMWILVIANIYFGIDTDFTISFATSAAKLLMGGAP